jgi:tetratricopeptide (TPR) repeat protein
MTDVTRHLGELMSRGDGEIPVASQSAADAGQAGSAADAAQGVSGAVTPAASAGDQAVQAAQSAASAGHSLPAHALDAYAFPYQSHEVFGLLPHSIGAKAEDLWQIAHQLVGTPDALTLVISGVLVGAVAVAAVSTARVWRRGEEFAVAGFGDRLTKVGTRYSVRQDAPISAFADKPGVTRHNQAADGPAEAGEPSQEAPAISSEEPARAKLPMVQPNTWRARRDAQAKRNGGNKPERAPVKPAPPREPIVPPLPPTKSDAKPEAIKVEAPKPVAHPVVPAKPSEAKEREAEPSAPLVAADETKRPKTVKRKLFMRSATTVNYAGSFHGSYGSFQQTDRLFARDYLKQTNEAFEAAYLRGKGPSFGELKVSDNHRGERLFMMATRASFEDPQTALAALWQAVDQDRTDAVAWLRLAHFYLELGEFDQSRRILEPLQASAEKQGLDIIVAAAANSLAKIAAQRGEAESARKLFAASIAHADKTDNPFMQGVACANFGMLEASRKKFDVARQLLHRGVKSFDSCEERVSSARTKLPLGIVCGAIGDDDAAYAAWSEAAETFHSAGLDDEAAQVKRWLAGEGAPNAIIL